MFCLSTVSFSFLQHLWWDLFSLKILNLYYVYILISHLFLEQVECYPQRNKTVQKYSKCREHRVNRNNKIICQYSIVKIWNVFNIFIHWNWKLMIFKFFYVISDYISLFSQSRAIKSISILNKQMQYQVKKFQRKKKNRPIFFMNMG
jgi:hypothetical protein